MLVNKNFKVNSSKLFFKSQSVKTFDIKCTILLGLAIGGRIIAVWREDDIRAGGGVHWTDA